MGYQHFAFAMHSDIHYCDLFDDLGESDEIEECARKVYERLNGQLEEKKYFTYSTEKKYCGLCTEGWGYTPANSNKMALYYIKKDEIAVYNEGTTR